MTGGPSGIPKLLRGQMAAVERSLQRDRCAVIMGPHQVGKSELAKAIASRFGERHSTLKLEEPRDREALENYADIISNNAGRLLVLDDVHFMPECLVWVREQCEHFKQFGTDIGQFLLLGANPLMRKLVTDHLATLSGQIHLSPIHLLELNDTEYAAGNGSPDGAIEVQSETQKPPSPAPLATQDELWLRGGFPSSLWDEEGSERWRERYLEGWYDREVPKLNAALGAGDIQIFFRRVAAHHAGEYLPNEHLPKDLRMCVGHFERAGLIRQLRPWPKPINKQECPHSKIFIRDSGLFHALRQVWTMADVRADARLHGDSWEGFCIENLISAAGGRAEAFHFRASMAPPGEQDEVDLILKFGGTLVVVECKAGDGSLSRGFYRICEELKPAHRIAIRDVESYVREDVAHIPLGVAVQLVREIAIEEGHHT